MNKCLVCQITVRRPKHKYCSHYCYWLSKIGSSHDWGKKISASLLGKKKTPAHIKKVVEANLGQIRPSIRDAKHPSWRGEQVGYSSLHDWVAKRLGRPKQCRYCGLAEQKRVYHWANLSGKYHRDLSDWARLCVPCHSKLDHSRKMRSTT